MPPKHSRLIRSEVSESDDDSSHSSDYESGLYTSSPSPSSQSTSTSSDETSEDESEVHITRLQSLATHDSRYQVLSRAQQNWLLQQIADYTSDPTFSSDSTLQRSYKVQRMIDAAVQHLEETVPSLLQTSCDRCKVTNNEAKLRHHPCERCALDFFVCWNHRINTVRFRSFCSACTNITPVPTVRQCNICTNVDDVFHAKCRECNMGFNLCKKHTQPILKSHCLSCVEQIVASNHLPKCVHCQLPVQPADTQSKCAVCQTAMHKPCTRSCICPSCLSTGSLASCSVCHEEIPVQQLALCHNCHSPVHKNRVCSVNGLCRTCHVPTQCASCKLSLSSTQIQIKCRICRTACHSGCLHANVLHVSIGISKTPRKLHHTVYLHSVHVDMDVVHGNFSTLGHSVVRWVKHILSDHVTCISVELSTYIHNWWNILIERGREINQLASLASIGVTNSHNQSFGGVQSIHNDACALTVDGQMYHFPVFHEGARTHPLFGSAASYLFHQSGQRIPITERYNDRSAYNIYRIHSKS